MKYLVKLDDACTGFSLYRDSEFLGFASWVGSHFINMGYAHGIDLSKCFSESHMLSILEEHLEIEIE